MTQVRKKTPTKRTIIKKTKPASQLKVKGTKTLTIEPTPVVKKTTFQKIYSWIGTHVGLIIIIAGILILWFFTGNRIPLGCNRPVSDTISKKSDTSFQKITGTNTVLQPIIVEHRTSTYIPSQYQPSSDSSTRLKQYQDLLEKYFSTNVSKSTTSLKDSTGKEVGSVDVENEVSENQTKKTSVKYDLNFPTITNTITLREPPKNQFFVGVMGEGSAIKPLEGVGGGLLWKNKKNGIIGANVKLNLDGTVHYGVSKYWKLGK